MISRIKGTLLSRTPERIEVETAGGVVYGIEVPLTIFRRLPAVESQVEIRTSLQVREDDQTLYGFLADHERELFERLITATGVGARLALAMLSTFSAERLALALAEKDVTALKQVSGVGKKTAERIVLELADKVGDLVAEQMTEGVETPGAQDAVAALVALGYSYPDADAAVREALEDGEPEGGTEALVRAALQKA